MRPNPSYRKADHLASPEIFEPIGCQLRVSNGVLNIPVSKVVLQRASIVAIIGEFVAASMAQHVRMDWEWHLGGFPEALDKPIGLIGPPRSETNTLASARFSRRSLRRARISSPRIG